MRLFRRLLGREEVPAEVEGRLASDERVLAVAALSGGGHLVVTSHGMWLPSDQGVRLVWWHLVSKATWQGGVLTVVEAQEAETIGGTGSSAGPVNSAVLLTDLAPRRLRFADPGRVPEAVHARVEGSIRSRHHRDLPGGADARSAGAARGADARSAGAPRGGAWFVQRKVPGRDGVVLQVRPDPGTDPALVRRLAADVVRSLGQ
jgi:hypothetical protein